MRAAGWREAGRGVARRGSCTDRMSARIAVHVGVVTIAVVLVSCGREPIYCREDTDCLGNRICEQRRCVARPWPDAARTKATNPPASAGAPSDCRAACRQHAVACTTNSRPYVPTIERCHRAGVVKCDREMEKCRGPATDVERYEARKKPCTSLRHACNDRSLQKCFERVCQGVETNCAAGCPTH